ncbi:hypothetical protein [Legionella worsleiensis]|nr:hypothetical protein [Legionella worsleiensis]
MRKLSDRTILSAKQLGISFPTQLPLFRAEPNREHMAEWANAQITPMTRQIAEKIIDNFQYISFERFMYQLQQTINDFHQKSNGAPYILLLGESRPDKLNRGCSDQWVIGLALEHCGLREPVVILTPESLKAWCVDNPDITQVLMLDDASYSGNQKTHVLYNLRGNNTLSFYLGIPFMSQYAERALSECHSIFKGLFVLDHHRMPSARDILDPEERKYAKAAHISLAHADKTITYFDHRFADEFSCFQPLYNGRYILGGTHIRDIMNLLGYASDAEFPGYGTKLIVAPEEYNAIVVDIIMPNSDVDLSGYLIPLIVCPYHRYRANDIGLLRDALSQGKVGARTPYPLIDQTLREVLSTECIAQEKHSVPFKPTKIAIEKQIEYDEQLVTQHAIETVHRKASFLGKLSLSVPGTLFYYNTPPHHVSVPVDESKSSCNIL